MWALTSRQRRLQVSSVSIRSTSTMIWTSIFPTPERYDALLPTSGSPFGHRLGGLSRGEGVREKKRPATGLATRRAGQENKSCTTILAPTEPEGKSEITDAAPWGVDARNGGVIRPLARGMTAGRRSKFGGTAEFSGSDGPRTALAPLPSALRQEARAQRIAPPVLVASLTAKRLPPRPEPRIAHTGSWSAERSSQPRVQVSNRRRPHVRRASCPVRSG